MSPNYALEHLFMFHVPLLGVLSMCQIEEEASPRQPRYLAGILMSGTSGPAVSAFPPSRPEISPARRRHAVTTLSIVYSCSYPMSRGGCVADKRQKWYAVLDIT